MAWTCRTGVTPYFPPVRRSRRGERTALSPPRDLQLVELEVGGAPGTTDVVDRPRPPRRAARDRPTCHSAFYEETGAALRHLPRTAPYSAPRAPPRRRDGHVRPMPTSTIWCSTGTTAARVARGAAARCRNSTASRFCTISTWSTSTGTTLRLLHNFKPFVAEGEAHGGISTTSPPEQVAEHYSDGGIDALNYGLVIATPWRRVVDPASSARCDPGPGIARPLRSLPMRHQAGPTVRVLHVQQIRQQAVPAARRRGVSGRRSTPSAVRHVPPLLRLDAELEPDEPWRSRPSSQPRCRRRPRGRRLRLRVHVLPRRWGAPDLRADNLSDSCARRISHHSSSWRDTLDQPHRGGSR